MYFALILALAPLVIFAALLAIGAGYGPASRAEAIDRAAVYKEARNAQR